MPRCNQPRQRRAGGSWTNQEDQQLSSLVNIHGERAWVKVAEGFNNVRDKKQCRERWCNHVNPNINGSPFSADENIFIINFYVRNGRQWAKMSRSNELKGRPDNAIKNHFNTNLLPHYIQLCKEHNLPQRMSDNIDPIDDATYNLIKGKVTAPTSIGVRGVKASRFLGAFSCKIENLVDPTTSPKTINERRRRAMTLQDIKTNANRLDVPRGPPTSVSVLQSVSRASSMWKPASMEAMSGSSSQWTHSQHRSHQLSLYNETMDWSESEGSMTSPSLQGRLSIGYSPSPYTSSEQSLPEAEERINPWCDSKGFYSLPPPIRSTAPLTPSALFSTLSFQSSVDEEHKALLHKKSNVQLRVVEEEGEVSILPPVRSLLFSNL